MGPEYNSFADHAARTMITMARTTPKITNSKQVCMRPRQVNNFQFNKNINAILLESHDGIAKMWPYLHRMEYA